jgi:hypothetical protein
VKLVHFHGPDGREIGVNPDQVVSVRPAETGAYAPGAVTVIVMEGGFHAVREAPADVEKKLEQS